MRSAKKHIPSICLHQSDKTLPSKKRRFRASYIIGLIRAKMVVGTGIMIVAALAGIQVSLSAQVATTGREIKELEQRRYTLSHEISRLQESLANLSSMSVIEKKAADKLGLQKLNSNEQVIYISDHQDRDLASKPSN